MANEEMLPIPAVQTNTLGAPLGQPFKDVTKQNVTGVMTPPTTNDVAQAAATPEKIAWNPDTTKQVSDISTIKQTEDTQRAYRLATYQKVQATKTEIENTKTQITAMEGEISSLNGQISQAQSQISSINSQISQTNSAIQDANARKAKADADAAAAAAAAKNAAPVYSPAPSYSQQPAYVAPAPDPYTPPPEAVRQAEASVNRNLAATTPPPQPSAVHESSSAAALAALYANH